MIISYRHTPQLLAKHIGGAVLVAALLLSGCSRSKETAYYSLSMPEPVTQRVNAEEFAAIRIGPIYTATYLNRQHIVTRTGNNQYRIDDYARWIEPLNKTIQRYISIGLNNQLEDYFVFEFGTGDTLSEARSYQIVMEVRRFDVDSSGLAVLDVQWGIERINDEKILYAHSESLTKQTDAGSYAAQLKH